MGRAPRSAESRRFALLEGGHQPCFNGGALRGARREPNRSNRVASAMMALQMGRAPRRAERASAVAPAALVRCCFNGPRSEERAEKGGHKEPTSSLSWLHGAALRGARRVSYPAPEPEATTRAGLNGACAPRSAESGCRSLLVPHSARYASMGPPPRSAESGYTRPARAPCRCFNGARSEERGETAQPAQDHTQQSASMGPRLPRARRDRDRRGGGCNRLASMGPRSEEARRGGVVRP